MTRSEIFVNGAIDNAVSALLVAQDGQKVSGDESGCGGRRAAMPVRWNKSRDSIGGST
jgi:hypothetical protein